MVTENGRRRTITKREAIASQLINKSAGADWRATKMLLDAVKDAEKQAGTPSPEAPPRFTAADEEVVEQLIERLRHQILSKMKAAATNPESPSVPIGLSGHPPGRK